ncbi:hypothetical protein JAAARDRAFT_198986 [Jaapia argillacea MUCL 33604]|uniref:Uncharacterized protein n=1 Tax=Jaapia argillacea MUCL 33604 TaxID=933084 RepID=A0A067P9U0_9AGAM|nr:hypothetical protein JAAARDRAFT_198986 [Jaapia argillacea MUCL 33604]
MLSTIDAIHLFNRITPTAHFFISPRYTRNEHGEVVDRADVIERERGLVTDYLRKAGYLQASLWTLRNDPTQVECLTVCMHRPTSSDMLEEAEGVIYYPTPVVTIRYDPAKDLQADATILPPLTRLRLSELPTVEPVRICIDSDTDVASSASYHPNSPTSSLHESDYQPVSPLLSALGDSASASTTNLDLEGRHPRPFNGHPPASPADAPNPRLPTPHPFALAVSAPATHTLEWPSLPTPPNEPTTVNAWGSGWTQEQKASGLKPTRRRDNIDLNAGDVEYGDTPSIGVRRPTIQHPASTPTLVDPFYPPEYQLARSIQKTYKPYSLPYANAKALITFSASIKAKEPDQTQQDWAFGAQIELTVAHEFCGLAMESSLAMESGLAMRLPDQAIDFMANHIFGAPTLSHDLAKVTAWLCSNLTVLNPPPVPGMKELPEWWKEEDILAAVSDFSVFVGTNIEHVDNYRRFWGNLMPARFSPPDSQTGRLLNSRYEMCLDFPIISHYFHPIQLLTIKPDQSSTVL